MDQIVRGINVQLVGVTDTDYRTAPASPDVLVLPYVQNNLAGSETRDTDDTIDGYRGMNRSVAGEQTLNGAIQLNAAPQTIGFWLKHLIGAPTSTTATIPLRIPNPCSAGLRSSSYDARVPTFVRCSARYVVRTRVA